MVVNIRNINFIFRLHSFDFCKNCYDFYCYKEQKVVFSFQKKKFTSSFECKPRNESVMIEKNAVPNEIKKWKQTITSVNIECEYLNEFTEWGDWMVFICA